MQLVPLKLLLAGAVVANALDPGICAGPSIGLQGRKARNLRRKQKEGAWGAEAAELSGSTTMLNRVALGHAHSKRNTSSLSTHATHAH